MPSLHRGVFRAASKRNQCDLTPAMQAAFDYMRRGARVPDSTVWEMVRERSGCLRGRGGILLDGFPRTLPQAESLEKLMEAQKLSLSAAVNYELPLPEIVERLGGGRACEQCKAVYQVMPPTLPHRRRLRPLRSTPLSARRRPA